MKHFITILFICLFSNLSQAQCTDLFFSEYVEGWSNNKALEIYNPTANPIDFAITLLPHINPFALPKVSSFKLSVANASVAIS